MIKQYGQDEENSHSIPYYMRTGMLRERDCITV